MFNNIIRKITDFVAASLDRRAKRMLSSKPIRTEVVRGHGGTTRERPVYRLFHVPSSKYTPKASVPGGLRRKLAREVV